MHLDLPASISTALRRLPLVSQALALALVTLPLALSSGAPAQTGSPGAAARSGARPRSEIAFAENRGQWDPRTSYVARMGALTAYLEDHGWVFTLVEPLASGARAPSTLGMAVRDEAPPALRGVAIRMRFTGGSARPVQEPEQRRPGCHNFCLGNDPGGWRTGVPLYASVRYHDLYPGIDVRLREAAATLEYDLLLDPGADLSRVQVTVEGAEGLRLADDGALVLDTALGPVVQPPPVTWQVDARGHENPVECAYVLLARDRFGFVAPERDIDCALVVDPKLVYSTYLGGSDFEYVADISLDAAGRALVVGRTVSTNYPTTTGAFQTTFNGGSWDGFVTVMNATGTALDYSTFLGGNDQETVFAGKLDANGIAHVAGGTWSTDFPTTPGAYDTTHNGTRDAFHCRLSPNGGMLLYSTLLGSAANDAAFAIDVDAAGVIATICGQAGDGLPTTANAYQSTYGGFGFVDGFVARLDPSQPTALQLAYSTFLGADLADYAVGFVQDAQGVLTILGGTTSSVFPTTAGAYQTGPKAARTASSAASTPLGLPRSSSSGRRTSAARWTTTPGPSTWGREV